MVIKQILLVVLLTISSISTFANDHYITTADVNVRTGAGKGYAVAFTLTKGQEVEVLSKNSNWYKISYSRNIGYVYSRYLQYKVEDSGTKQDLPEQNKGLLVAGFVFAIALLIGLYFYREAREKSTLKTVTELNRGTASERALVLKLLRSGMPADTIFHDLYVKKETGGFSQVDLVAVTEIGIIVFEVKDYSGWLYGRGNQEQWTQVMAYGKQKYRFYNPIRQNNSHITALKKQLARYNDLSFFSMIVFYGNSVLKEINYVPRGTCIVKSSKVLDALRTLRKENASFNYTNREELCSILKEAVALGSNIENKAMHQENIKDMLGKHRIFD
jgi:uncharacterized protein YraI